jgi:hypothetical protein
MECVVSELYYSDGPQTAKSLLKIVKLNYPDATKSNINSILYEYNKPTYKMNSKNLVKSTVVGIPAPLWWYVNLSEVYQS